MAFIQFGFTEGGSFFIAVHWKDKGYLIKAWEVRHVY